MNLPRLLLIADKFTDEQVAFKVRNAVKDGVCWVQLRDHMASSDNFDVGANKMMRDLIAIDRNVLITINSRITFAAENKMHFHTGLHGPSLFEAKLVLGSHAPIGVSVHNGKELAVAVNNRARYVIFSPIFETSTHPGVPGVGLEVLRKVCFHTGKMPVLAMGGITPEKVTSCLSVGAYGVAVNSSILEAASMFGVIQEFKKVLPGL
ncbi:MAG: thiamine phosphate synthase [Bacteroidetes bacterium]|nr:thiamine phosphate synthase [Bacteroidota bacterium]